MNKLALRIEWPAGKERYGWGHASGSRLGRSCGLVGQVFQHHCQDRRGEIGILPGHEPVLGVLVPSAVVIFCEDNPTREIIAVEGGFISVSQGGFRS